MKNILFLILTTLLFTLHANAQDWVQEGATLYGAELEDYLGKVVTISSDGNTIAFSSPSDNSNGTNVGLARVYTNVAGTWVQKGTDIIGVSANGTGGGSAISISGDGNTLAIGTRSAYNPNFGARTGRVDLYRFDGTDWSSIGTFWGNYSSSDLGAGVSISYDGNSVAISAEHYNISYGGEAFVYDYSGVGTTWTEVTGGIYGTNGTSFGASISISADGNFIAVGAPFGGAGDQGITRVYSRSTGWTQMGANIVGEASNDFSGEAISISADGQRVAIAARYNDGGGTYAGHVRVYQFNAGTWTILGNDIDGTAFSNLGSSIDLTGNGNILAVGGANNVGTSFGTTNYAGFVRVFEYDGTDWIQRGTDIDGANDDDGLGGSVAISDSGDKLVAGASNGQDPAMVVTGYVQSYSFLLPCQTVPTNNAVEMTTATNALFTWDAVPDASLYQVKYRLKGTTTWLTAGTTNTQRNISNLTAKKYYQYKVRVQCTDGNWSDFTAVELFYTSACDAPTGVASIYLDNTRMRIRWDNNPSEIKAKVRYREVGTSTWYTQNSGAGNNYIYINNLTPNVTYQYKVRSNCSGNDWSAYSGLYTHDLSSSMRLAQEKMATKIYPNPASEVLNIEFQTQDAEDISITITNSLGKMIQTINNNYNEGIQRESININELAKGYYFITIRSENRIETQKFLRVE